MHGICILNKYFWKEKKKITPLEKERGINGEMADSGTWAGKLILSLEHLVEPETKEPENAQWIIETCQKNIGIV